MDSFLHSLFHLLRLGFITLAAVLTSSNPLTASRAPATDGKKTSVEFIPNQGQWDADILFKSIIGHTHIVFRQNSVAYYFVDEAGLGFLAEHLHQKQHENFPDSFILKGHAVFTEFNGANTHPGISASGFANHYYNYFVGSDPHYWATGVHPATSLTYHNIYEGIDLRYYSEGDHLKYEFIVKPGADPTAIRVVYGGAKPASEYDQLYISTPYGTLKEKRPDVFQYANARKQEIDAAFCVKEDQVTFRLGNYDRTHTLIIDPAIIFATYSGSSVDNFGFTATYDSKGHLYAGGIAGDAFPNGPGAGYPVTAGAFQKVYKGGNASNNPVGLPCDITISKYSPDGTSLLYATYLGGSRNEFPHSLVADKNDNLIIFGSTSSSDFPVTTNASDKIWNGGTDIIVCKFDDSCKQLLGATYIGGLDDDGVTSSTALKYFYADDFRGDVITDDAGNIYVASCTKSATTFPTTPGVVKPTATEASGVVFKMSPDLSAVVWATFLGGVSGDKESAMYSIDIGPQGNLYLSGGTTSGSFIGTSGGYQPSSNGAQEGVIVWLKNDASAILNATYFGTSSYDQVFNLELDPEGHVVVVGQTEGTIPITSGVYGKPNSGQFLVRFNDSLTRIEWSTLFGSGDGKPDITINAFLVDECGNIFVSGWGGPTSGKNFSSTFDLEVTGDAFRNTTSGQDFYLMVLAPNAEELLYATFFGGSASANHVDGGTSRFSKKGIVYQSVCASCQSNPPPPLPLSDFPTTPNAAFPLNKSLRCSNAAFKFDLSLGEAKFSFTTDTCTGITTFRNETPNFRNSFWDFGDGDTSSLDTPSHVYLKPGDYIVTLTANPKAQCAVHGSNPVRIPEDLRKIVIPNVFTPNGDEINDKFEVTGVNAVCDHFEIWIYNRWGNLFFHTTDPLNHWNGQNEAKENAPEGVYFYIVDIRQYKGEKRYESGTVSLIRNGR